MLSDMSQARLADLLAEADEATIAKISRAQAELRIFAVCRNFAGLHYLRSRQIVSTRSYRDLAEAADRCIAESRTQHGKGIDVTDAC